MDITSTEAISFNVFYLNEFLNITLKKIEGKVAKTHFEVLENISSYLVREENIVDGLEKLAKFQQTNDLAIFLFDMVERANDYGPKIVYNTLPDLADDFLSLYALMVEDDECVDTLQKVVDSFKEKFGEINKTPAIKTAETIETPQKPNVDEKPEGEISFNEFYST